MKQILYLALGVLSVTVFLCNEKPTDNDRLRARLAQHVGVWEGVYTYTTPSGERLDRHASRQETWLDGDTWHQRIAYRWDDGREQTLEFNARLNGDRLVYDDPTFDGALVPVTDDVALYLGVSKQPPRLRLVESIVTVDDNHQTRSLQMIEEEVWTQTVFVEEHRVAGGIGQ